MIAKRQRESGATAIFIVVFAAILLLVVTLGFMRTMIHEQGRSTDSVLSQSAYDAALAGVEDGKRVVTLCQKGDTNVCNKIAESSSKCDLANLALGVGSSDEVLLKSSAGDVSGETYDQAYTCLRINPAPGNYSADIARDQPLVIPLSVDTPADSLEISWQKKGVPVTETLNIDVLDAQSGNLYSLSSWNTNKNKPPMLRVQLIRGVDSAVNNTSVQFLYPSNATAADGNFAAGPKSPVPTACTSSGGLIDEKMTGDQKCRATLKDGSNQITGSQNYLVITPIYADAAVTLNLPEGSHFVGIQNVIDSTGRANDVFRRVSARVDLIPHPTYPNAALTLSGPLCKNFMVTPESYTSGITANSCN